MCAETGYIHAATKRQLQTPSCTVEIVQGSVRGHKNVSTDSEQVLMSSGAPQLVPIARDTDQSSFQ